MSKILEISKYSVWMIPHNYAVGVSQVPANARGEEIVAEDISYHPELQQALKNVYKRMVKDAIKNKNKILTLSELRDILLEIDKIMKNIGDVENE